MVSISMYTRYHVSTEIYLFGLKELNSGFLFLCTHDWQTFLSTGFRFLQGVQSWQCGHVGPAVEIETLGQTWPHLTTELAVAWIRDSVTFKIEVSSRSGTTTKYLKYNAFV